MAQRIKHVANDDALVISSPANRAASTARIAATIWEYPKCNTVRCRTVSSESEIWQLVRQLPVSYKQLVLFGHNEDFQIFYKNAQPIQN